MNRLFALVFLAILVTGCSVTKRVVLGDGSTIDYQFAANGMPMPAQNRLARVFWAGPLVSAGEGSDKTAHLRWAIGLDMRVTSVKEIVVTDVTLKNFEVIVKETQPVVKESRWIGKSPEIPISPNTTPWLYQPGSTMRIFRIDIKDDHGKTQTLYQPSLIYEAAKGDMRTITQNINSKKSN